MPPHEWTEPEWAELLDLSLDGALPQGLQAHLDAHLAVLPEAAADAAALRAAMETLKSAPAPRPDNWFVERALQSILHEHHSDTSAAFYLNETRTQGE